MYINDQLNIFGLILLEILKILTPKRAIAKTITTLNTAISVPKYIGNSGFIICTIKNTGDTKKTTPAKYKDANTINAEITIGTIIIRFSIPKPNVATDFTALAYVLILPLDFPFLLTCLH